MALFRKKPTVDPADFLALRGELLDLRSRLDATEQEKAAIEARLLSLDATASAFTSERTDVEALRASVEELRSHIADEAPLTSLPATADPMLAAKVDALHSRLNGLADSKASTDDLHAQLARLDELQAEVQRLAASEPNMPTYVGAVASAPGDDTREQLISIKDRLDRLADVDLRIADVRDLAINARNQAEQAALAAQTVQAAQPLAGDGPPPPPMAAVAVDPDLAGRLADIEERLAHLVQRAEATPAPPPPAYAAGGPPPPPAYADGHQPDNGGTGANDAEVAAIASRLDAVDQRLGALDSLVMQINQLNARVSAQAELGGQVAGLRDRISQLQDQAGVSDELREQVTRLSQRTVGDDISAQVAQLAQRLSATDADSRSTREQVSAIEQRLAGMGTELANQISELGRDIDQLANRPMPATDTAAPVDAAAIAAITDEMIETLRTSQVKLANEQARYEIAFRQDLAALAEQVRRGQVR